MRGEPVVSNPDWSAQIERCLRLATQVDDPLARQRLNQLADEYRARAAANVAEIIELNDPTATE